MAVPAINSQITLCNERVLKDHEFVMFTTTQTFYRCRCVAMATQHTPELVRQPSCRETPQPEVDQENLLRSPAPGLPEIKLRESLQPVFGDNRLHL